jgi:hypothetical protein
MSNLNALAADVFTITNRPDLTAETYLALRAATLKAHQSDFFPKDLLETALMFDTSSYQQSLQYKQIFPRWRALKYVRKYDNVNLTPGKFIEIASVDSTLDSYAINREDICYIAGSNLQIRSIDQQQYYLIGIYQHPDVTTTGYDSWIADEHPFAIIYEAARAVFKMIGFDEQSATFDRMVAEQYTELKAQILGNGW